MLNNFFSSIKDRIFKSRIYEKYILREKIEDFKEKLLAIYNFQHYIEDQTSFTAERKMYKDTNNLYIELLKKDIIDYLNTFKL